MHPAPSPARQRAQRELGPRIAALGHRTMLELFDHLEDCLDAAACEHGLCHTEAFLVDRGIAPVPAINWLRQLGAECDCEIIGSLELNWRAENESPRVSRVARDGA